MKVIFQKIALIAALAMCVSSLIAEEAKNAGYHLTVSSPIYRSQTEKIDLNVTVPKNFRPVQTAAQAAKLHLLQFIPQDETPQNWTQLIVLQILGNQSINAAQFTQMIAEKVKIKTGSVKVLTKSTQSEDKYMASNMGIYYETGARREISYMNYYSSPGHLSGIQYVRALKADEQPEKIIQEMIVAVDSFAKVTAKNLKKAPELNVYNEASP